MKMARRVNEINTGLIILYLFLNWVKLIFIS